MEAVLNQPSSYLPTAVLAAVAVLALVLAIIRYADAETPYKGLPLVGLEEEGLTPKEAWNKKRYQVQAKGLEQYDGRPFQVMTETGPKVLLPNHFAEEFRKNDNVTLLKTFYPDFMGGWPGFDGITFLRDHERIFVDSVRIDLTRSLDLITDALVDETKLAVPAIFGQDLEWRSVALKQHVGRLVAQLSSRVFLGEELCRNETWLEIARNYTVQLGLGSVTLRSSSSLWRPITYWWNPHATKLRKYAAEARRLIGTEVKMRKARARKALEAGQKPPKAADTIGWMVAHANGRDDVDYAAGQLGMTFAGIHTTTEALGAAIVDLCNNPGYVQPLRDEIVSALKEHGWSRDALYKMRLVDSFLKESQRFHSITGTTLQRIALQDITLSDGTVLPRNTRLFIAGSFFDPSVYPEPFKFDAYRFLKLKEASEAPKSRTAASTWQHTTMSPEHLGFGYGEHGCPGRFFASNELKIALSFLLLEYDWRLEEDGTPQFTYFGTTTNLHSECRVSCRRRVSEVEL